MDFDTLPYTEFYNLLESVKEKTLEIQSQDAKPEDVKWYIYGKAVFDFEAVQDVLTKFLKMKIPSSQQVGGSSETNTSGSRRNAGAGPANIGPEVNDGDGISNEDFFGEFVNLLSLARTKVMKTDINRIPIGQLMWCKEGNTSLDTVSFVLRKFLLAKIEKPKTKVGNKSRKKATASKGVDSPSPSVTFPPCGTMTTSGGSESAIFHFKDAEPAKQLHADPLTSSSYMTVGAVGKETQNPSPTANSALPSAKLPTFEDFLQHKFASDLLEKAEEVGIAELLSSLTILKIENEVLEKNVGELAQRKNNLKIINSRLRRNRRK